VLGATSYGDLSQFAQQQSRASAFILSIDDEEFTPGPELDPAVLNLRKFIEEIRFKNADIPIYLYGETRTSQHIPNDVLRELHGFIHMFEDTPEFVARHIIREAKSYLDGLAPPFFKALMDYAQDGSYSWHCPGHSGGVAFLKSPVGQMFHQFFGENMLRADVCNAVEELGQLLDHTGPVAQSERNAARIFNADHCFFVTNGTSTSNKMVWHHTVAPGDVVVVDRNCHKSILHSIIMTGAVPVFLTPTRNHYGIIGPIPQSEFTREAIERKIAANPLLAGVDPKTVKPRILTLTQSTYDGVLYNTETIKHGARRLHRQPAFRRGLAAARRLPQVLRQLPRDGQEPPAAQGPDGLRHAEHAQAAGRHQPGQPGAGAGRADASSSTSTCSTRPT
jgi:arginine decarboxylase